MGRGFVGGELPTVVGFLEKGFASTSKNAGSLPTSSAYLASRSSSPSSGITSPSTGMGMVCCFLPSFANHDPADDGFGQLRCPFRGGSLLLRRGAILGVNEGDGDVQSRSLCGEKRHFCGFGPDLGRAMGETMAAIMVLVNSPQMPTSLTQFVRTLASNIALSAAR